MKKVKAVTIATTLVCLSSTVHGEILASYPLNGSGASNDAHTGSTAGVFTVSDTVNEGESQGDSGISGFSNTAFSRSDATGATEAAALADDDFFSFTVSVDDPGSDRLSLTSLVFDFGGSNDSLGGGNTDTLTTTIHVLSSVGGLGAGGTVIFSESETTAPASGAPSEIDNLGNTVDLSGTAFSSLTSITFEFRFSDDLDQNGSINRLDNVVLHGQIVPIPEPASLVLIGLGSFLMLARTRGTPCAESCRSPLAACDDPFLRRRLS